MVNAFEQTPARDRIIVALDCDVNRAFDLADMLEGHASWMKIGMTLYYAQGPSIIYALKERGFKVFLDLKFHDIPHQIEGAAAAATRNGADMITMHTVGGVEMMKAAERGAEQAALDFGLPKPITLGITVLTSMNQEMLEQTGVNRPVVDQVKAMAQQAASAGLSGVVASPMEAKMLRETLGTDAYIVTPGVRPAGAAIGDQSRVATPQAAFDNGASHLVIGRPITQAEDPLQAFEDIVNGCK